MGRRKPSPANVLPQLQEFCQQYRQSLLVRGKVTRAEVEAVWPGGAENPELTTWAWVRCYGSLRAMLGRLDPKVVDVDTQERRRLILEAMAEVPEAVELTSLDPQTGDPRVVMVHPKSDIACHEIHNRNLVLARMVDDAEVLRRWGNQTEDLALCVQGSEEQSYLQRLICWISITPGPGLPYPEQTRRPALPPEVVDLNTVDYYLLAEAFQRVNVLRLAALQDSKTPGRQPDWPVYFASVAGELGGEMTVARLRRDRSIAAVIAESAERVRGAEEARARVDEERRHAQTPHIPVGGTSRQA